MLCGTIHSKQIHTKPGSLDKLSDRLQIMFALLPQVNSFVLDHSAYVMLLNWWMCLPLQYPPHPPPHSP